MFVIALLVNKNEEYLREKSGDDCFSDELGNALTYETKEEINQLGLGEYIVEVREDKEGFLYKFR